MKIAIVTDTHHGARGDSQAMLNYQKKFFDDIFFPTLKEQGITHIVHMGDIVDRRTSINFNTVKHLREDFLDPLVANGMTMDVICGNHDVYYKSTNTVNAFDSIFGDYRDIITTYIDAQHNSQTGALYLPWINKENEQASYDALINSEARFVFGHLEINGFEMMRGHTCDHGILKSTFQGFESVFSGHFHHKSSQGNIHYLGAPYEMTWSDYDSPRGFHLFDTETGDIEFVQNPYNLFVKIIYRGTSKGLRTEGLEGAYIKVVVDEKSDPYEFDKYIELLENRLPSDIKIVEAITQDTNDEIISQVDDTQTILVNTIDKLDVEVDKNKLKQLLNDLYTEALDIERDA